MKRWFSIIFFILASSCVCKAQFIDLLNKQKLNTYMYDLGVSFSLFTPNSISFQSLSFIDDMGYTSYLDMNQTKFSISIPLNIRYKIWLFTTDCGYRSITYTPKTVTTQTAYAKRAVHYPYGFKYGYISSNWAYTSIAAGFEIFQLGLCFDYYIGSTKKDNSYLHFKSIGNNSYSSIVPTIFIKSGMSTSHLRVNVLLGFQTKGYLDGIKLFKTTGIKQSAFDDAPSLSFGLSINYKFYSSYGKYHVYNL